MGHTSRVAQRRLQGCMLSSWLSSGLAHQCADCLLHARWLLEPCLHAPCAQGVSQKNAQCETCGQKLAECSGHFGYVSLQVGGILHSGDSYAQLVQSHPGDRYVLRW